MSTIRQMVGRGFVHILPRPPPLASLFFTNQFKDFSRKSGGSEGVEGNPIRNRVDVCTHIPLVQIQSPALLPDCGPSGWFPPWSLAGSRGGFDSL